MKRQIIRVEPLSTYLERWKAPTSGATHRNRSAHKRQTELTQVQWVLYVGGEIRHRLLDLLALLSQGPAGANICLCTRVGWPFRY
jgi:hypothetical protein